MTNVEAAAREPYGNELRASLQTLRRAYAYNHAHDAVSLTAIMVELAAADAVRQLDDAPEPNNEGNANAVDGASSYVRRLFDDESSYADSGTAAAATYDSDSSNESAERRGRDRRARKKKGGAESSPPNPRRVAGTPPAPARAPTKRPTTTRANTARNTGGTNATPTRRWHDASGTRSGADGALTMLAAKWAWHFAPGRNSPRKWAGTPRRTPLAMGRRTATTNDAPGRQLM